MQAHILTIALLGICLSAYGQTPSDNGLLPEDTTYERLPLERERSSGDEPDAMSLRSWCPVPGNQGDMAACVGWALAHALTIHAKLANPKHQGAFSASYIFNQIKVGKDCRLGAYLSVGLGLLQTKGVCLTSTFPDSNKDCHRQPGKQQYESAISYRIVAFHRLFKQDDVPAVKNTAVIAMLARRTPVVVGLKTPAGLRTKPLKSLNWKTGAKTGHALVVVGYDEKKREVELLNSYGPKWGDKGFFRLSYDDFWPNLLYGYWLDTGADFGKATSPRVSKGK